MCAARNGGLEGARVWCRVRHGALYRALICVRVCADTGTLQTVRKVAMTDGALALWNGFLPYYGRCGGHTVTMFVAVDQIRAFYQKVVQ